tara:strand:+ start:218 stop:397 length:180 start_codon:yes stop_codon:yes gene_type:complete
MTDWKYYEELEEESYSKTRKVRTKKKKTWKQMNEEKNSKPTKKQWQKKRRKPKNESNIR